MRTWTIVACLVFVSVGCSSSEDAETSKPKCDAQDACEVDLASSSLSAPTSLADLCPHETSPANPSSGLYTVCVVGPDGKIYLTVLGGSVGIDGDGWTSSGYSNGTFPSTLSPEDQQRCQDALLIGHDASQVDGGSCPNLVGL